MAFKIAGQPGVSAFLVSLLRDLDAALNMSDDLWMDVNSELKKIEKMLRMIQDVLVGAERKRLVEKCVDLWMDELKDLFYDIDDLVDEIKMEKRQLQQVSTSQPSSSTQVCSNFSDVYNTSNIIKRRLSEVSKKVDDLAQEAVRLELKRDAGHFNYDNWVSSQAMVSRKTGSCVDESEMHGRDKDKDVIVDMLLADDGGRTKKNYEVVGIVGMGGLGKTALAQLVFQDQRIKDYFTVKSWACVSDVFDVIKVIKELLEHLKEDDGKSRKQSLGALQNSLKSIINGKKFLLVLDDVWTTKEWDKMKSPFNFGAKGSKIIVTTREFEVAKAVGSKAPYKLERLEDAHCQEIFNDNAFEEIDGSGDAELMKLGKEIVRKCGGVPLVAKVIGAMLRGKGEGEWKNVKENDIWNLAYEDEELHPGLRLSYFYLPSFLKRCFEYFALFPSYVIHDEDELVRVWMAEGLIEVKEGRELEEMGSQYYNDLKGRSLIQENNTMHDMVHHLACIVSGKFFYPRNSVSGSSTSSIPSVRHACNMKKSELLIDAHKLRTLFHEGNSYQKVFSYKKLRVLEIGSVSHVSNFIRCDLKHLRYLSLGKIHGDGDFPDSIFTLTNLQVLDFNRFDSLQNLPQDIGKLSNLRYLRLRKAKMTTVPDSICSLSNLRLLDLSRCRCLTTLPNDIGNPQKVHELEDLNLGGSGQVIHPPNSICMLSNLQVLNLSGCSKLSILPESVCNLVNLRVLDLSGCECLTTLPNDIGNLQRLQKIRINTKVILPESIVNATNLDELPLWNTKQPAQLGKLTKLEKLGRYCVGKEKGQGIDELKDMNKLKAISIWNMENIASVEEASLADLKSKKLIERLIFNWEDSNDETYTKSDGEMAVRIMDVLEPHVALKYLTFKHYRGHDFPRWMSSTQFHNLTKLYLIDLPMATKIEGMVFQSLKNLQVESCPALKEISMTTSKLERFQVLRCKKLKPAAIALLPGLWDTLEYLGCDYFRLDLFMVQLKATNASPCTKLRMLTVSVGVDDGITILPVGCSNIFTSLMMLYLTDLPPTNFKIVCEEDQKLLESITALDIFDCPDLVSLESSQLPPCLVWLGIKDCPNLTNLPSGLRYLSFLQHIHITRCPNLEIGPHDLLPLSVKTTVRK